MTASTPYFEQMSATSLMKLTNRNGDKIAPCGVPFSAGTATDRVPIELT
jgi:hypothetical protein